MTTRRNEMRRALLIAFAGGLMSPRLSDAQQRAAKIPRIAYLDAGSADSARVWVDALRAGLHDLRYVEGKNIIIEYRWADGKFERLPQLAAELVHLKADVIVASTAPAIRAVQSTTAAIPIVILRIGDPVGAGFAASLARPGQNITGVSNMNPQVMNKYLELLRVALPRLSRAVVLANPGNPTHAGYVKRIQETRKTNRETIAAAYASTEAEIDTVIGALKQERPSALIVLPDSLFYAQARQIVDLATQQRLPTMFAAREPVEAGGLMSYGQNNAETYYRAATYVDKILKGAKPRDLPIEQPTKFELVINLRTAKTIGLAIPRDLLLRADTLIE